MIEHSFGTIIEIIFKARYWNFPGGKWKFTNFMHVHGSVTQKLCPEMKFICLTSQLNEFYERDYYVDIYFLAGICICICGGFLPLRIYPFKQFKEKYLAWKILKGFFTPTQNFIVRNFIPNMLQIFQRENRKKLIQFFLFFVTRMKCCM